jgi:hypothetical protein
MKLLGRVDKPQLCRYGCCRQYPEKGKRAPIRSAKRREERAWRREAS